MLPSKTLSFIAYMSLVASNIIVIDEFNSNINEYHCNPDESCTIGCLSTDSCTATTLYCPLNHDCTIICDGRSNTATKTCFNSTIHAEQSNHLSITVTAHQSNAESMTIYAPSNPTKTSTITCNSNIANLHQCKNINIHTIKGFDDIRLQCNDQTPSCHISGLMQCEYSNNNHCETFEYMKDQNGYECADNNFCATNMPSLLPTMSPTVSLVNIVTQDVIGENIFVKQSKEKDIHSLVLVIVGTVVICCVILILLSLCGVLFVKFNKDTVEEILIKRYISGRGSSCSTITFKRSQQNVNSNDSANTSNDTTNESSGSHTETCTINQYDDQSNSQSACMSSDINNNNNSDSNDMTLSTTIYGIATSNECDSQYQNGNDELDDIPNNINRIHDPNNIYNNISIESIDDDEELPCDSIVIIGEQTHSVSLDLHSYENEQHDNIRITPIISNDNNIPALSLVSLMSDKHRQIHEENIRNRAKCYGYSQPEILYEEDENYTDDSAMEMKSDINKNGEKNSILETKDDKSFTKEYDENDMDSEGSDSDDLLEDGEVEHNSNDSIQIKIESVATPLSIATSEMKDPEIVSDDGQYPNLPPHAIIQYGNKLCVNEVAFKL